MKHANLGACLGVALALISSAAPAQPTESAASADRETRLPEGLGELEPGWYARIDTSLGVIVARLLPEQAPQSVAHFAGLAQGSLEWLDRLSGETKKTPYYDGILVNRAVAGQRFEAGDRHPSGRVAPEFYAPPEGYGPIDFRKPGRLGMTRIGGRTSAVVFFVTAAATPWLNTSHPCFGEVVHGKEVAFGISQVKTYSNGAPLEPVTIERIRIIAVGDPPPLPEPVPYSPRTMKLMPKEPPR